MTTSSACGRSDLAAVTWGVMMAKSLSKVSISVP